MKQAGYTSLPEGFRYRLELRLYVTPRGLKDQPIHRWFWFPHSFSPQLLDEILSVYPLPPGGRLLDPFVGAGTAVLRALQLGHAAVGVDLSPLSLFVSRVKVTTSSLEKNSLNEFLRFVSSYRPAKDLPSLPRRLRSVRPAAASPPRTRPTAWWPNSGAPVTTLCASRTSMRT